jgi:Lipocalin-like domain
MEQRHILSLSVIAALGLASLPGSALSQQKSLKEQLTGTWTLVSNDNVAPDGITRQLYGANPKGIMVLDTGGHYVQIYVRPDIPKFKSNNRQQGTPEENQAVVHGTTAQFGTWSVDEGSKTLIVHIEGSMFPNQAGTDSKRSVTLAGDDLKVSNPTPGSGGRSDSAWKRAK